MPLKLFAQRLCPAALAYSRVSIFAPASGRVKPDRQRVSDITK